MKFKLRAFAFEYFEEEIEAPSLEEAKEIFMDKDESGELESIDSSVFFEGEDGFDVIEEIMLSNEDE